MDDDSIVFQNMDTWRGSSSGKFGLTFKQIIMIHINRCVTNGSVEWHGGYWQEKVHGNQAEKYYVQNSREVFCNSIRILRALLLGYYDKRAEKADEEIQKELESIEDKYRHKENKEKKAEYYEDKIGWYIKLFEELVLLSKRLNFFEEEVTEDEM